VTQAASCEERVLVLAPTAKDAGLAQAVFERAGMACVCCRDLEGVCAELDAGAAAVVLTEEAVVQDRQDYLAEWLKRQPRWSDLPLLVLARPGADSAAVARAMDLLGNVTVLERPTRVAALVSAVRTALRARQRQYQIREHLAEREKAEAALRADDHRKNEFLAILAHELRNPLAPIRNSIHVLRLTESGDTRIARLGEMMERQLNHLVRLVDDLLEISRITSGKIELRRERVEVASLARTAVEASRPLIDAAGHELSIETPAEPLTVEADPVRLAQVFANLLNNAAKYTDPGGRIRLGVRRSGDGVLISVRDTGTGISAEMLPRVFDLFTQVDHRSVRAQGGLGIGLTLAKSLVEMHGGTLQAHSDGLGKGSEFVVRLPLAASQRPPRECAPSDQSAGVLARLRLLVVDDNRDAADSLAVLLELLGAEVHLAYAGADALLAVEAHRPDVVLLDIGMPEMDGYEVARRIRERTGTGGPTLIALSGWGQEEDLRRTREAGFDHHLIKPADLDALKRLLTSVGGDPEKGTRGGVG
jgi:signal transduction histidine kinase/ActR/RegA family two-component response regulator